MVYTPRFLHIFKFMQEDINAGMYAKYTKKNKVAMDNAIAVVDNDMAGAQRDFSNVVDNGFCVQVAGI